MDPAQPSSSAPALLAPGSLLGAWRIVALAGRGVNGEVYRAVRAGEEHAPQVALKLAVRPWDSRFSREAKLLSLVHHPSAPRLLDQGVWRPDEGAPHPFLVMEWVDGEPLYAWAQRQAPTSQQVLRLLNPLAQALADLHAQGGVHRDVKGDNILVRREDGRAVLTDFGSGVPPGATTLTPPGAFVGTPAYRSAESWLFELRSLRKPEARYGAQPADDVFALGVTACRLLTGQYPEPGEPSQDESGIWSLEALVIPPALQAVEEPLRGIVLSMLAVNPEQRPTAAQLAQTLEQADGSEKVAPAANIAAWARRPGVRALAELALTVACLLLAAGAWWAVRQHPWWKKPAARSDADVGTSGLGDSTASLSQKDPSVASHQEGVADEPLPEPQPGQLRPDAKGRCPGSKLVLLNGVCWVQTQLDRDLCEGLKGQMFQGMCYQPFITPGRPPTSSPKKSQDGAH